MARIERKAHYIGTWREDHVTDSTMRQIIARSQAEKGQKVKVKLSRDGLNISRTVLFQENFLSAFPLPEVYFLTVNPQHPTCLLCIVADPVKKYLIVALRTASHAQSREMVDTFQTLKGQPTLQGGNVVLRRKDNGNWTLRERSQHNANRHMQQIFQETSATPSPPSSPSAEPTTPRQPNGHVSSGQLSPAPYFDGGGEAGTQTIVGGRRRAHSASQTAVGAEGSEEEMAMMRMEVDNLTQELRDIKLVLERTGTISPRTPGPPSPPFHTLPNSHAERTHHVTADVSKDGHSTSNGPVVTAYSQGHGHTANRPGEARVYVDDHREDFARTLSREKPATNKPLFGNTRVQRQITVPEPNTPPGPANGYGGEAAYTIQRRVTREPVLVSAEPGRKVSSTHSLWNSGGVKVVPAPSRHTLGRQPQFRSMRISRSSGVPTTVVRSIEETYARGNTLRRPPVVLVQSQVPYGLQEPAPDVYIAQQSTQPSSAVYIAQRQQHHTGRPLTPNSSFGRSASPAGSARVRHDTALHHNGGLDDVLL